MKQYVVTISRQFGSLGRTIAQKMSRELGIDFYDRDIVEETASRMGLPVSVISGKVEHSESIYFRRQYPLGMGITSSLSVSGRTLVGVGRGRGRGAGPRWEGRPQST